MNNIATITTYTGPLTDAPTSTESPAVSGNSTALDDYIYKGDTNNSSPIAGMYAQLAGRPAEAANDAVTPVLDSDRAGTSEADGPHPVQMSRDRALTLNCIGPRLTAARQLSGYTQTEAALKMGYKNPTQLSLFEQGRRAPPLYIILAASTALGVSIDFLFGVCPDPERDARAARRNSFVRAVHQMLTQTAENIADGIEASDALAGPDASNYREMLDAARSLTAAVEQYHRLNVEQFEDSRGGATVLAAVSRMDQVHFKARDVLRRHDAFAERMRLQIAAIGPLIGDEEPGA